MQTALHIMTLVEQIRREAIGGTVVGTEYYKKERAAYIFIKAQKTRLALGFLYHPHGSGVFLVPASKIKLDTREKPWPFFELDGATLESVIQMGLDRLFEIALSFPKGAKDPKGLVGEALGPNGNLLLLDSNRNYLATLRKRDITPGTLYTPPDPFDGVDPFTMTAESLQHLRRDNPDMWISTLLQKNLLGFSKTLVHEAIERSNIDPEDISPDDLDTLATTIRDLATRFRDPDTGYLHRIAGRAEVYPFKLTIASDPPEKFKTLSMAVQQMTAMRQSQVEQADERKTIAQAVSRAIKRMARRIEKIEKDLAEAADFEKYKKLGELLQINFDSLRKGMESITIEDVYADNTPITIPLDPAQGPSENIDSYFKRHRKGREGLELLQRRLEISRDELDELKEMEKELDRSFDSARERFRAELAALLPKEGARDDTASRLPFKEYKLSTGLTIYVGRDGSDNDRTTFEFARPYEIWLHTQQCPGSHVVIKHPNKSFVPSKQEIAEAAAIAAWFSKARNDTLVPVVYTERRYVRKPRKAKPGLVTVEREKSVMVAPTRPND